MGRSVDRNRNFAVSYNVSRRDAETQRRRDAENDRFQVFSIDSHQSTIQKRFTRGAFPMGRKMTEVEEQEKMRGLSDLDLKRL